MEVNPSASHLELHHCLLNGPGHILFWKVSRAYGRSRENFPSSPLEYFRELGTIHEKFPPRGRLNSVYVRYDENLIKFTRDNLVPSKLSIWKLFLLLGKCMSVY